MNRKTHRLEAILTAQKKLTRKPVYLDVETTGMEELDEIIEIAVVDHDGSVLVDSFVKPIGDISPSAYAIHGITEVMIKDAPTWIELWPKVEESLRGRVLGIYNADFDIRMMEQSHYINKMTWQPPYADQFCIMKLYAQFHGDWNPSTRSYRWQKLDTARGQCNISIPNSHRAKDDTLLARAIINYMANQRA